MLWGVMRGLKDERSICGNAARELDPALVEAGEKIEE